MKKILFAAAIFSIFNFQFSICHAQQPEAKFKMLRYEWTLNADGTSDYHYRHEVQILRNSALTAYADKGETFVVYNPDLEELKINEVYTLQADGKRVDMPQNAFIYQLPSECADCGRFNHMRELAMVHTGMEIGCTIVVDYTIHRKYNLLYEDIALQRECPVEKMEVVVKYPEGMDVHYHISGSQYLSNDNVIRTSDINTGTSVRELAYTLNNMPQAPAESYMPADIVPTLRIYNSTPEHTPAFNHQPFVGARDVIAKVMTDKGLQNIVNVRNYVVDNIHLNDIHPSHFGYVHATPEETWRTGCGTAIDKAVFLAAVLNDVGYRARVIGEDMDEVGVMVDTVEYRLDVRSKLPMEINGEAKDEVATLNMTNSVDVSDKLDTLEDGFFALACLFPLEGEPEVSARYLTSERTTPLVGSACDLKSDVTFLLPKGIKMVGDKVSEKIDFPGVGSLEISIKQSGKKLRVVRNLKVEKSVIEVKDYANYRQLMAMWQSYESPRTVLLRSK